MSAEIENGIMFGEKCFKGKDLRKERLVPFGFVEKDGLYQYSQDIMEGKFRFDVFIDSKGNVSTKMWDKELEEEYVLYKVESASGNFVGEIRENAESILNEIASRCFESDPFKGEQAHEVVRYIKESYDDEPEFLWDKYPDIAIWRAKINAKWYALMCLLPKNKLEGDSSELVEVMNLTASSKTVEKIVDGSRYFRAWHMNKKTWYTVILDGRVGTQELISRIEESRLIAFKKK